MFYGVRESFLSIIDEMGAELFSVRWRSLCGVGLGRESCVVAS